MQTALDLVDKASRALESAVRWLALIMTLIVLLEVLLQAVFGFASTKLSESIIYMHAVLLLLAAAPTLLADEHVRVDVLYGSKGPRYRKWVNVLGGLFLALPATVVLAWTSWSFAGRSFAAREGSTIAGDGLPFLYLLKGVVFVFSVLLIVQILAVTLRALITPAAPAGQDGGARPSEL